MDKKLPYASLLLLPPAPATPPSEERAHDATGTAASSFQVSSTPAWPHQPLGLGLSSNANVSSSVKRGRAKVKDALGEHFR